MLRPRTGSVRDMGSIDSRSPNLAATKRGGVMLLDALASALWSQPTLERRGAQGAVSRSRLLVLKEGT